MLRSRRNKHENTKTEATGGVKRGREAGDPGPMKMPLPQMCTTVPRLSCSGNSKRSLSWFKALGLVSVICSQMSSNKQDANQKIRILIFSQNEIDYLLCRLTPLHLYS